MIDAIEAKAHGKSYARGHSVFWSLSVFLFFLVLTRDVFFINVPNIVYITVTTISYIYLNREESIAYTLMMIPLGNALAVNYIIGIGFIIMLQKRYVLPNKLWTPFIFLIIFEFLHFLVPPFDIVDYFRWMLCMIMLCAIAYTLEPVKEVKFISMAFVFATLVILTDILLQSVHFFGIEAILNGEIRLGNIKLTTDEQRLTDVIGDLNQNTIGQLSAVSVAILLILHYFKKIKTYVLLPLVTVFCCFGFLCMSRTFIVTILITFFVYILLFSKSIISFLHYFILSLILIYCVHVAMTRYFPQTVNATLVRFEEEDVSSGRKLIFKRYNAFMMEHPEYILFGIGNLDKSAKTKIHSPHNALQELFVSWGVIGIFAMCLILRNMYVALKSRTRQIPPRPMAWLVFVPFFVSVQSGQLFSMNERMLYFALCMLVLQIGVADNVENN